jgi:hypothetical protein
MGGKGAFTNSTLDIAEFRDALVDLTSNNTGYQAWCLVMMLSCRLSSLLGCENLR